MGVGLGLGLGVAVVVRRENETGHLAVSVRGGVDKIHDHNFTAVSKVSHEERAPRACQRQLPAAFSLHLSHLVPLSRSSSTNMHLFTSRG